MRETQIRTDGSWADMGRSCCEFRAVTEALKATHGRAYLTVTYRWYQYREECKPHGR